MYICRFAAERKQTGYYNLGVAARCTPTPGADRIISDIAVLLAALYTT